MPMKHKWFAALLLVAACEKQAPTPASEPPRQVRVETVSDAGDTVTRRFSGTIQAGTQTKLSFQLGGTITELHLKVGDKVKRSQIVATLKAQDQSLQVQSAAASVRQVEAQLANSRAQYGRIRALYENNTATQADLDQARTAYESAQAGVSAAKKQLELAEAQAGKTVLRCPVDGVVASVAAEAGENVNPGQPVVVLNSGSLVEVEVAVPETVVSEIAVGMPVSVTIDALSGKRFAGTVSEVAVTTGRTATTYPVTATLTEHDDQLREGMAADVELVLGRAKDRGKLVVNPKAVGEDRQGRFVFVAKPRGGGDLATVHKQSVTVGALESRGLEVKSGVKAGDLVVTAGLTYLTEGKQVRLPKDAISRGNEPPLPTASASGTPATQPSPAASSSTKGK